MGNKVTVQINSGELSALRQAVDHYAVVVGGLARDDGNDAPWRGEFLRLLADLDSARGRLLDAAWSEEPA